MSNAQESVKARLQTDLTAAMKARDEVTLSTMDPMKPAVLRGVGHDEYLYLLMPVRVP